MKKNRLLLLAGVIFCLLLAACTGKNAPDSAQELEQQAQQAADAADAYPETDYDTIFEGLTPRDDPDNDVIYDEVSLLDVTEDGAFDEVCSYAITYPQTEDEAFSALNPLFAQDAAHLKSECETVCETAAARSCVANVEGEYLYSQDAYVLTVEYELTATYSDTASPSILCYIVQYDLRTCTRVEE